MKEQLQYLFVLALRKDWNDKKKIIKKFYTEIGSTTRLSNIIQKKKPDAMDIIVKLNEEKTLNSLSLSELKNKIAYVNSDVSFFDYTDRLIENLKLANRHGTASLINV